MHLPVVLIPGISEVCIGFGATGGGSFDLQTRTEQNMLIFYGKTLSTTTKQYENLF